MYHILKDMLDNVDYDMIRLIFNCYLYKIEQTLRDVLVGWAKVPVNAYH